MKSIISPLLVSQVQNFPDGYVDDCIASLENTIKNSIKLSASKQGGMIDQDEVDRLSDNFVNMILEAVLITDTSVKFIAEDQNPFELMFHNMHQTYHLGVDGPSGDNWYLSPVVHNDLTGMYIAVKGYNSPIKILDLQQHGDEYHIIPVTRSNTPTAKMIAWNQEPLENMKSLCYHVRGEELLKEIEEAEGHIMMAAMVGQLLNALMQ